MGNNQRAQPLANGERYVTHTRRYVEGGAVLAFLITTLLGLAKWSWEVRSAEIRSLEARVEYLERRHLTP